MRLRVFMMVAVLAAAAELNVSGQDLFAVSFRAECLTLGPNGEDLKRRYLNERDIIAGALGLESREQLRFFPGYALVYNSQADSLQVVDGRGEPVADVVHFAGGTSVAGDRYAHRFTYMFFPGQTDASGVETNVIGTAVITERGVTTPQRAAIFGRVQYALAGGLRLGTTNVTQVPGTNGVPGGTNGMNGTNGVPGTNGVTNGVPGTNLAVVDIIGSGGATGITGTGGATGITGTNVLSGIATGGSTGLIPGGIPGVDSTAGTTVLLPDTNGVPVGTGVTGTNEIDVVTPPGATDGAVPGVLFQTPVSGPVTNGVGRVFFVNRPTEDNEAHICTGIFVGHRRLR